MSFEKIPAWPCQTTYPDPTDKDLRLTCRHDRMYHVAEWINGPKNGFCQEKGCGCTWFTGGPAPEGRTPSEVGKP